MKNVKLVTPTLAPKYEVNENTIVTVNLSGGEGKNRVAVHSVLTFQELGIDPSKASVLEAPSFPNDAIATVNGNDRLTGGEKAEKIKNLIADYNKASSDYSKNNQGMEIEDLINVAVINWLVANHNFTQRKTDNKPYISPTELLVNSFAQAGGVIFMVTGTAIWGR